MKREKKEHCILIICKFVILTFFLLFACTREYKGCEDLGTNGLIIVGRQVDQHCHQSGCYAFRVLRRKMETISFVCESFLLQRDILKYEGIKHICMFAGHPPF